MNLTEARNMRGQLVGKHEQRVLALIKEGKILIKDPDAKRIHNENKCGEFSEEGLVLSGVEALYLLERGKIRVINERGIELSMNELAAILAETDPGIWIKYLVYSDLRRRGYVLRPLPGPSPCFMLYERGTDPDYGTSKYLVYAVVEGVKVDFKELEKMSERARRLRKELILAVLDRQGEIAYYAVNSITL